MNKKTIFTAIFLAATLTLSGCTAVMWTQYPPSTSKTIYKDKGTDHVHTFGRAQEDSAQIKKGSLVMMGQQFWYILPPKNSDKLFSALNVKHSHPYEIKDILDGRTLTELSAIINEKDQSFATNFCLHYQLDPKNPKLYQAEKSSLEQAGFKPEDKQPDVYKTCFRLEGNYYARPNKTIPTNYQFQPSIPVKLNIPETRSDPNIDNIISNTLMTPFTLAIDAVGAVIALPVWILTQGSE